MHRRTNKDKNHRSCKMVLSRVAVHYIGCSINVDEWIIGESQCKRRIRQRNTKTIGPRRTRHKYFRKYAFVIFCGRNEKCVKGNHNHDSKAI